MTKNILIVVTAIVIVALGALYFSHKKTVTTPPTSVATSTQPAHAGSDAKNATYIVDGTPVTLVNGLSEVEAAPGSASKITTRYFGNEVIHDFNGDGRPDVAFLLTQDTGGSGTFYYVAIALNTTHGFVGSQALLLGDRIAPQSTVMSKGNVVVINYADRKPGESFAVPPSEGKSMYVLLDPATMILSEVKQ